MQSRYHRAWHAFHIYETMTELMAPNVSGQEEAEANVRTINSFRNFFVPIREATRVYFFLELAKMFDTSSKALQITKLVEFATQKRKNLTVKDFVDHNKDRKLLEELVKEYKGLSESDLKEIRNMLERQRHVVSKLLTYRNKWLAHDDLKRPETPSITGKEIYDLFKTIEKIMNTLGSRLNNESWVWDHAERDAEWHTKLVIEHLRRFEPYRLKEINEKMEEEMKKCLPKTFDTISPMETRHLESAVKILTSINHMTLATVCADGSPWNTPVSPTPSKDLVFRWGSNEESVHSQNVRREPRVFVVIYDSTAPDGLGEGVYMQGIAEELDEKEGSLRMYRFTPQKVWINDEERNEDGSFKRDVRVEIPLRELEEALKQ